MIGENEHMLDLVVLEKVKNAFLFHQSRNEIEIGFVVLYTVIARAQAGAPGQPYTENQLRNDYSDSGVPSPVTGNPPEQRPSYFTAPAGSGSGTPGTPF